MLALVLLGATGTARASDAPSDPSRDHPVTATPAAQTSAQDAGTMQAATADATAVEPQPTNVFVSVRIDSPGDGGPVTQTSTTTVVGAAADTAATDQTAWQDWAPAAAPAAQEQKPEPAQASDQDAATDQAASATAAATHAQPVNTVVSVRVNSPGDDGPVTQRSAVVVDAASGNVASTTQTAVQSGSSAAGAAPDDSATAGLRPSAAPAEQPSAPPAPESCVTVGGVPGTQVKRIVITIGAACKRAAPSRPAARPAPAPTRSAPKPKPRPALIRTAAPAAPAPAELQQAETPAPQPATPVWAVRADRTPPRTPRELPTLSNRLEAAPVAAAQIVPVAAALSGRRGWSALLVLALVLGALLAATLGSMLPFLPLPPPIGRLGGRFRT